MTTATVYRGTPTYSAGKFGNALSGGVLSAAGVLSSVAGTAGTNITATFTAEAWVRSTATGNNRVAVGRENIFWLGHDNTGKPKASYGNGTSLVDLVGTGDMRDGLWHHMAFVLNAGAGKLFFDGVQVASSSALGTYGTATPYDGIGIGSFVSGNTAFDWVGQIDEVAISTTAQYTGAFTLPTAFASTRPGQVNLWHLEADGTDSDAADVAPPTIGTITLASSGGTDTITYPAPVTGANPVAGVSLYEGTSAGGESATPVLTNASSAAGTFTRPTAASGAKYYYVRAYDNAATPIYSVASNEVSGPPPAPILPNNPAFLYSPYTWDVNSSRALCNTGGYIKIAIGGSPANIVMNFDVSNVPASSSAWSQIAYRVDNQAWTTATPTATMTVPIPAATAAWTRHTLEIVVKSTSESYDRWNSPYLTAVKFLGLTVANGVTVSAPQRRVLNGLMLGDSITEGVNTLNNSGDTTNRSDSRQSWAFAMRDLIGAEIGVVGFGRQGLGIGGNGNVPVLGSTWKLVANGINRSFTPTPDFVVINIGTNDQRNSVTAAAFTTALTALLNDIIATLPATTKIFVMFPFGGYYGVQPYKDAIAASSKPKQCKFIDTTGWWNTADASDGLHPFGYINVDKLGPMAAQAVRAGLNAGARYVNVGGVAKVISERRF